MSGYVYDSYMGNDPSFFTQASDFVLKGLPATVVASGVGVMNTGIALGNSFGANMKKINAVSTTRDLLGSDIANYYRDNSEFVDTLGIIASSIVPGIAAVRALRAGQVALGNAAAREGAGLLTKTSSKLLTQTNNISRMRESIRAGHSHANQINKWGVSGKAFHQNLLESFVFETAAILTNNQNSVLNPDDLDYFDTIADNLGTLAFGTVLGGAIGGGIGTFLDIGSLKAAQKAFDESANSLKALGGVKDVTVKGANPGDNLSASAAAYKATTDKVEEQIVAGFDPVNLNKHLKAADHQQRIEVKAQVLKLVKGVKPKDKGMEGSMPGIIRGTSHESIIDDLTEIFLDKTVSAEDTAKAFSSLVKVDYAGMGKLNDTKALAGTRETLKESLLQKIKLGRKVSTEAGLSESSLERAYYAMRDAKIKGSEKRSKINPNRVPLTAEQRKDQVNTSLSSMLSTVVGSIRKAPENTTDDMFAAVIGYGSRSAIKDTLSTTAQGKVVLGEAMELIKKGFPELHKNLNDLNLGRLDPEATGRLLKLTKVHDPDAMFAYALRAQKALERNGVKTDKIAPSLKKLLDDPAVASRYKETELYFNTKTREFTTVPNGMTAADVGPMGMFNKRLNYAKDKTITKLGQYSINDVITGAADQIDMTAQWAFAQQTKFDVVGFIRQKERQEVKAGTLPELQRIFTEFSRIAKDGTTLDKLNKILETNPIKLANGEKYKELTSFAEIQKAVVTEKRKSLLQLINKNQETNQWSSEDLAAMLDVDLEFVLAHGVTDDMAKIIKGTDYTKTQNIKLTYDANDLDRSFAVGKGMVEVERKLKFRREEIGRVTSTYLSDEHGLLPPNAVGRATAVDPAATVTSVSETQTLLKSFQANTMGEIFWQGVGKVASMLRQKRIDTIGAELSAVGKFIQRDSEALAELSVINAKLAQGDYAIIHGSEINELAMFLDNYGQVLENSYHLMPAKFVRDLRQGDKLDMMENIDKYFDWNGSTLDIVPIRNEINAKFLESYRKWNTEFVDHRNKFNRIGGDSYDWNPETLPAVIPDLKDIPEIAIVQFKGGKQFGTGKGVISARNSKELEEKISVIQANRNDVEVTRVSQTERDAKILGDFDWDNALTDSAVNSDMRKLGVRWDVLPESDPRIVDRFVQSSVGRRFNLDRQYLRMHYVEDFRALELEGNVLNPKSAATKRSTNSEYYTPQEKMINAALGLQNIGEYKIFRSIQEKIGEAVDRAGSELLGLGHKLGLAYQNTKGNKNAVDEAWEAIAKYQEAYNMPEVYRGLEDYIASTSKVPKKVAEGFVSKANAVTSYLMLRADGVQGMVNCLSTPITLFPALKELNKFLDDHLLKNVFDEVGGVKIPGTDKTFFANAKVVKEAVADFFKNPELVKTYRERGLVSHDLQQLLEAVEGLGSAMATKDPNTMNKFFEAIGPKLTFLSDKSEEFTRFIAARSAEKIIDKVIAQLPVDKALPLTQMKYSIMNNVVTKVHGNYVAAQRPTLFQGWMGQALGLFQTYQFNLIQTLVRNLEHGDVKNAASMLGLQGGIFGAQSLPGFQLVNEHIGKQGQENGDIYSATRQALGKDLSHFFLYGAASSASLPLGTGINFYTRGDLTPRTPILIPTSLSEIPVVSFATKFVSNIANTLTAAGVDMNEEVLYQALAHNGINRPLAGLGQLLLGERTTANGSTLLQFDELDNRVMHTLAKLAGTTTTDESIAMDAFYRAKNYQSARQAQLNSLGLGVKHSIRNGRSVDMSSLMQDYIERGGDGANFDRWYQHQAKSVNESQLNEMRSQLNSPEGRYLQSIMD